MFDHYTRSNFSTLLPSSQTACAMKHHESVQDGRSLKMIQRNVKLSSSSRDISGVRA